MYDDKQIGYDITAIALGIDALERNLQKGSGSLDTEGLIPIYVGDGLVAPRTYRTWQAVHEDLDELKNALPVQESSFLKRWYVRCTPQSWFSRERQPHSPIGWNILSGFQPLQPNLR